MSGFEKQTYTQTPNSLFEIMADMDECELKVVLYICRYTFGYHRESVKISTRKIAKAIKMSVSSVQKGAEAAEKRGLIVRVNDGQDTTEWFAIVNDDPDNDTGVSDFGTPKTEAYQNSVQTVSKIESQVGLNKDKEIVNKREKRQTQKRGDLMDGILAFGLSPEAESIKSIRARFEKTLKLSPAWDGVIWRDFDKWLIGKEKGGQAFDTWAKWWQSDDFRATKQTHNLTPDKIKLSWLQAFCDVPIKHEQAQPEPEQDNGMTYAEFLAWKREQVTA